MKEREYCKNWRRMFGHTDTIGLEMNAFRAFGRKSIIDGPLGKVKYYAIRVEFQFTGSPHIDSFLWVIGAPVLTKDTKKKQHKK